MKKSWIAIPIVGVAVAVAAILFPYVQDGEDSVPFSALPDGIDDATRMAVAVLEGEPSVIPGHVASGNNDFAIDLYRQLPNNGTNVFFSPISIYVAMSMLYEGANPDAAAQIQNTFGFDPDLNARYNDTAHMLSSLNREDPHATLAMANALWDASGAISDEYVNTISDAYLGTVEAVSISDGHKRINQWASDNTNGKIDGVVGPLHPLTLLVLTNAIYFKGTWATQFDPEDTRPYDFDTGNGMVSADMMSVYGRFDYADTGSEQVLRMPYDGDRLSMLVVLPRGTDGIDSLEERLSADQIKKWQEALRNKNVVVDFPKFETESTYILNDPLMQLGVTGVFGQGSLPGINPKAGVSVVKQDGYVNVNEEGTEAAAVTTIVVLTESVPPPPPRFVADHPFIYFIIDDESSTILFMGKVTDPTA